MNDRPLLPWVALVAVVLACVLVIVGDWMVTAVTGSGGWVLLMVLAGTLLDLLALILGIVAIVQAIRRPTKTGIIPSIVAIGLSLVAVVGLLFVGFLGALALSFEGGGSPDGAHVYCQIATAFFARVIASPSARCGCECPSTIVYPCADAMTCTRTCDAFELVAINRLDRDATATIRCGVIQGNIQADFILENRGESTCD